MAYALDIEKRRPDNGPGSNGLRGGSRTYSIKVQTPNWVENYGGPSYYKRGFTNIDFETEGQHQQKGATNKGPPQFGAGLPLPSMHLKPDPSTADSFVETEPVDRRSTMQYTNQNMLSKKAEYQEYRPEPTLSGEELMKYRTNWTADDDVGRTVRFKTESRLAGASIKNFGVTSVRLLPGSPKSLELFRERTVQRFGIFGFCALRAIIGLDEMSFFDLRERISSSCVDLSKSEFDQITAFVTASTQVISGKDFLRVLKGNIKGFDPASVKAIFNETYSAQDDGSGKCNIANIIDTLESKIKYPEIVEGIKRFISAYSCDLKTLSEQEFIDFNNDMHAASSDNYKQLLQCNCSDYMVLCNLVEVRSGKNGDKIAFDLKLVLKEVMDV